VSHLVLVRHGRALARWGDDYDPGLDPTGAEQAAAVADALALFGPLPVFSSPMQRCLETAAPLAARWAVDVTIEPRVGEVKAPSAELAGRGAWLDGFLHSRWSEQSRELLAWRDGVVAALLDIASSVGDAVVFTHFVGINAAVGVALGDPRVVVVQPDNCSRTELSIVDGQLSVVP
jgi:broad specificity phosphatase PhoE